MNWKSLFLTWFFEASITKKNKRWDLLTGSLATNSNTSPTDCVINERKDTNGGYIFCATIKVIKIFFFQYLHCVWPGVGGNGRILSGGQRLVTNTVAGSGIDVPPFVPVFMYGTGNCLKREQKKKLKRMETCYSCAWM